MLHSAREVPDNQVGTAHRRCGVQLKADAVDVSDIRWQLWDAGMPQRWEWLSTSPAAHRDRGGCTAGLQGQGAVLLGLGTVSLQPACPGSISIFSVENPKASRQKSGD